jgi:WD40 repeat protein
VAGGTSGGDRVGRPFQFLRQRDANATPFPQFHPLQDHVATLYWHAAIIRNGASNLVSKSVLLHDDYCMGLDYSPDGRRIATVSIDTTARLWDATTGEALMALRHDAQVETARFSPDGQLLVTGGRDKSARLWNARTGQLLAEPIRQEHTVLDADVGAGGLRATTISETDTAWLWDVRLLQPWVVLRRLNLNAEYARFSPDGRKLVVVKESETIRVWDAQSGQFLTPVLRHSQGTILDAQFSPDGRRLATTAEDRLIKTWDAETGTPLTPGWPLPRTARFIRFSPDGTRLAAASGDGIARLLDSESGQVLFELAHADPVRSVEFSRDGRLLVTASADGTARIWSTATGQPKGPPLQHEAEVCWAEFDRGGRRVATASRDKTARVWSVESGRMLTPPLAHADELEETDSVTFSPNDAWVATASGNAVQVWDAATGQTVTPPLRQGGLVRRIQFSPIGSKLLIASRDGVARLLDPATGHAISEPMRHGAGITSAEFSPDGGRIVTCSSDLSVRIWEVTSAPQPVPEWLPDLAEALAAQRIDERDVSTVVPVETLYRLRQRLLANNDSGHYGRWARWFFSPGTDRRVTPSAQTTTTEYVHRRIADATRESLTEAALLSGTNAVAFARLATNLVLKYRTPLRTGPPLPQEADWFSHWATNFAPNDPETQSARQGVIEILRAGSAQPGRQIPGDSAKE